MSFFVIPFPAIDPVLFSIGPLPVRWYALAYIAGLVLGWLLARRLVQRDALWGNVPHPDAASLDDLLFYAALGTIIGGRLFNVLFYGLDYYLSHPGQIFAVWNGGMAFHGGFLGVAVGVIVFARRRGLSILTVGDLCAAVAPIGLFFGRLANFIKPELWGRPSDVPWAMVFPGAGPEPRHPSQLYEAGLEGLALFALLALLVSRGAFRRPGLATGVFLAGYGVARIVCEFFREPDPELEALSHGLTMGMVLSMPFVVVGIVLIVIVMRRRVVA
jgi:phosphatidylglycerol:prolipoprotein diacylglycerol transferase